MQPTAQRAALALSAVVLLAVYAIGYLAPGLVVSHEDAALLVAAKSFAIGSLPPLFPLLLRLFALVSEQPHWLKLLPLACTAAWLFFAYRLLLRMGSGTRGALVVTGLTASSPGVLFLATHLLPGALFALLIAATLLALLDDRSAPAGLFAGLATLASPPGIALIVVCILTLAVRRRFVSALRFTAVSMLLVAPWLGLVLAHGGRYYKEINIVTALHANEKLVVLARNSFWIPASPFALISGSVSGYAALGTVAVLIWALVRRRQMMPDLFLVLYCLILLTVVQPPERAITPVLPWVLWILWRGFQNVRIQEAPVAAAMIFVGIAIVSTARTLPDTLRATDWRETSRLFAYIRANTPPNATILANLDDAAYLGTGRRTVRGFQSDNYQIFYAPDHPVVTPDQISGAILQNGVDFVVLTPDHGLPESPSFHQSVDALARGGMLEPVAIPGLGKDYRLLRTASFQPRR